MFRIILFLMLAMISCKVPELSLAEQCAEAFPPRDSLVIDTLLRSDTILLADQYIEYIDTTVCPPGIDTFLVIETKNRWIKGDTIVVQKLVYDTIMVIRSDTALVAALTNQLNKSKEEFQRLRDNFDFPWWAYLIIAIISAMTGYGVTAGERKNSKR